LAGSACGRWGMTAGLWHRARTHTCARTGTQCLLCSLCTPRTAPPPVHRPPQLPAIVQLLYRVSALVCWGRAFAAAAQPGVSAETSPWHAFCTDKPNLSVGQRRLPSGQHAIDCLHAALGKGGCEDQRALHRAAAGLQRSSLQPPQSTITFHICSVPAPRAAYQWTLLRPLTALMHAARPRLIMPLGDKQSTPLLLASGSRNYLFHRHHDASPASIAQRDTLTV